MRYATPMHNKSKIFSVLDGVQLVSLMIVAIPAWPLIFVACLARVDEHRKQKHSIASRPNPSGNKYGGLIDTSPSAAARLRAEGKNWL